MAQKPRFNICTTSRVIDTLEGVLCSRICSSAATASIVFHRSPSGQIARYIKYLTVDVLVKKNRLKNKLEKKRKKKKKTHEKTTSGYKYSTQKRYEAAQLQHRIHADP